MNDHDDPLARIAAALERLAPQPEAQVDLDASPAFVFAREGMRAVARLDAPGLDERGNVHLAQAIMPLCRCERPGRVSFGTEAGMLQQIGVPTIVCGPGEIRVAHQPDEYVETSQLAACLDFLDTLTARLARGDLALR